MGETWFSALGRQKRITQALKCVRYQPAFIFRVFISNDSIVCAFIVVGDLSSIKISSQVRIKGRCSG